MNNHIYLDYEKYKIHNVYLQYVYVYLHNKNVDIKLSVHHKFLQ